MVDAACLAHDLGHPPFGHNTERELDHFSATRKRRIPPSKMDSKAMLKASGSLPKQRSVTRKLRASRTESDRRSLNALLKYPWGQRENGARRHKWGFYRSERSDFEFARRECGFAPKSEQRSLEAAIMNLADDISYAVHDVEDFVRAGLIPTAVFTHESNERIWFQNKCAEITPDLAPSVIEQVLAFVNLFRYKGRHTDLAMLSEFRSESVNHFISTLRISLTNNGQHSISRRMCNPK